jgi:hypothetical protein
MSQAIHSNFLIHWTGKDIEEKFGSNGTNWRCKKNDDYNQAYLDRLKSILNYGLWMTKPRPEDEEKETFMVNDKSIRVPDVARTCFTELKLSQSDMHSSQYGRLGIGVKRGFLFDRLGGPVFYLQHGRHHLFFPPFTDVICERPELLSFFKRMSSDRKKHGEFLKFNFYDESEWRIVFSEDIKKRLDELGEDKKKKIIEQFVNPREWAVEEANEFKRNVGNNSWPEYLLPLDAWFSMIIYPNPYVKIGAKKDNDLRKLIEKVKKKNFVSNPPDYEYEMMPMEIDLPSCRNF